MITCQNNFWFMDSVKSVNNLKNPNLFSKSRIKLGKQDGLALMLLGYLIGLITGMRL